MSEKDPKGENLMLLKKDVFIDSVDQLKLYHTSLLMAYEEAEYNEAPEEVLDDLYLQIEAIYNVVQQMQSAMVSSFVGNYSGKGPKVH